MKTQVLQLLLCKYDVPFATGDTAMDLPVCKITAEGTGGSGMASFGQGTAIHHTDSVYGIQIGVIHFLPFVRGILGVLADGGQKIVFFAIDSFDAAEIALPYTVQRLVFTIVISGFQGQYRNILIVISQFLSTIFGCGRFITAEIFPAFRSKNLEVIRHGHIYTLCVNEIYGFDQLGGFLFGCFIIGV